MRVKNKINNTEVYMNMKPVLFVILFVFAGAFYNLSAQQNTEKIPKSINFSAVLTDSSNNVVSDGEYDILFSFYTSPENGEAVWSEFHEKVPVENGEVNIQLGGAPIPLNLSFDKLYYLGIQLNGGEELKHRIELIPSPYSIRTLVANNVKENSITTDKIAPNSITDDKIKSVSWSKIKDLPEINKLNNKPIEPEEQLVLPKYWRRYGNWLETGNEWLGTVNDRNLVIKVDSIQRMVFEPYGRVIMGTVTDSVFFEVIGTTTLGNTWVKERLGVGADFAQTQARVHIKSTGTRIPFKVDNNNVEAFVIESNGRTEITSKVTGADDDEDNYSLFVNSEDQGIAIKIDGASNSDHNYMTFWDDDGIAGRIEGQDAADYLSEPKNIAHDVWLVLQGVALGVAIAANVAGGLEIPDAINGAAEILYFTFQTTWDLTHLGVTYESSSGDYAEWLEKANPEESFSPGEIVGVHRGKISKNTNGAEQIMSISLSPLVLGNMPEKDNEHNFEKVAFKGQVPVIVKGVVNKGDYIIPSGFNDGMGIAVEPNMMTTEEFSKVLGRAWEENPYDEIKIINVSVGLKMKDLVNSIRKKSIDNRKLEIALSERNKELDNILTQLKDAEESVKFAKDLIHKTESTHEKTTLISNKK